MATLFLTGGNRGIGKAILRKFVENHYDVIVSTRKQYDDFESECQQLAVEYGVSIHHIYMDLSNRDSIKEGLTAFGALKIVPDVVVNNAGIFSEKTLMMTSLTELDNIFQVNYFSIVQISQYMAKKMLRTGGTFINISSVGGIIKQALGTSYGASKAALNRLTTSMAQELAPFKIRVNAIAIGIASTDMGKQLSEKSLSSITSATAVQRCCDSNEIADVIYYLSSKESSYITGQIIRVDGGLTF